MEAEGRGKERGATCGTSVRGGGGEGGSGVEFGRCWTFVAVPVYVPWDSPLGRARRPHGQELAVPGGFRAACQHDGPVSRG